MEMAFIDIFSVFLFACALVDSSRQSYSMSSLGTRGEIESIKMLVKSTGLAKPKARALLMSAKEVI